MKSDIFIRLFLIALTSSFMFLSCSDDDISLSDYDVQVGLNQTISIHIEKYNGGCSVSSADESIAIASINDNQLNIEGKALGETTIIIKDKIGKTAAIKVKVVE